MEDPQDFSIWEQQIFFRFVINKPTVIKPKSEIFVLFPFMNSQASCKREAQHGSLQFPQHITEILNESCLPPHGVSQAL